MDAPVKCGTGFGMVYIIVLNPWTVKLHYVLFALYFETIWNIFCLGYYLAGFRLSLNTRSLRAKSWKPELPNISFVVFSGSSLS